MFIVPRYGLNNFVVGVLLSRGRRPGIRYLAVFVIQHCMSLNMTFNRQLKTYFLRNIDEMHHVGLLSALEIF